MTERYNDNKRKDFLVWAMRKNNAEIKTPKPEQPNEPKKSKWFLSADIEVRLNRDIEDMFSLLSSGP